METAEEEIGGYAWYRWKDDGAEKSVFGICVRADCQGRGAGRVLLGRLIEIAKVVGPPVMSLTVQKANERAFNLYRKFGFEVVYGVYVLPDQFEEAAVLDAELFETLDPTGSEEEDFEAGGGQQCPACEARLPANEAECPECGLRFPDPD